MSEIIHEDIARFAMEKINLPKTIADKHRRQVNLLRERLEAKIVEDPAFDLVKMLHAGSVAKGTALRTVNDLDVAVPRVAQRDFTHEEGGLRTAFMALLLSEGRGRTGSSPEKGAQVEGASRAIPGECASRCAIRGQLIGLIPTSLGLRSLNRSPSNVPLAFFHSFLPSGNLCSRLPLKDIVSRVGSLLALTSWGDSSSGSDKICRL